MRTRVSLTRDRGRAKYGRVGTEVALVLRWDAIRAVESHLLLGWDDTDLLTEG